MHKYALIWDRRSFAPAKNWTWDRQYLKEYVYRLGNGGRLNKHVFNLIKRVKKALVTG